MQRRRLIALFSLTLLALLVAPAIFAQNSTDNVVVLEVDSAITSATVSYLERGLTEAGRRNAEAVLVRLDTPGGDLSATLDIVQLFRTSRVPIIVYVGPAGAQAASAGSIITMAGHASGMAPETVIGAAAVVGGGGQDLGETLALKATEDMQAVVRSLTERRGPEVMALAESMISEARAVHDGEALAIGLIDAVANDEATLLNDLDGFVVSVNAADVTLMTADAQLEAVPPTFVENVLQLLSDPIIIGFLVALAVPAILIELQAPGGYVAGIIGVTSLALAAYGYGQLPTNWLGLIFVATAFVLLALEVKTGTVVLGVIGAFMLLAGLLVVFNSPGSPEYARIPLVGAVVITVVTAGFFVAIAGLALRARLRQPTTGMEGMVGMTGQVRRALSPSGMVLVNGELWRAQANNAVESGTPVVVKAVQGFTLRVEPLNEAIVAADIEAPAGG